MIFLLKFFLWISTGNDCLVCGSFFNKILKENEEDVNCLQLNEKEQLLFDFGNAIARDPHNIPQEIYDELKSNFTVEQIVTISAFAGLMCATNLFNTVAKVDLDEVLYEYRIDN